MPLLNTDAIHAELRAQSGTELIADFGLLHQGKMGYADCRVAAGIEQ